MHLLTVWMLFLLGLKLARSQTDLTVVEGTTGTEVVTAVVDIIRSNCIFSDDRLFLRRLAYVETQDGTDPNTYRPGYDGGIWQVDNDKFQQIQPCPTSIRTECNLVSTKLGITWAAVTWSDMRKPLYSGLGAALYMIKQLRARGLEMPGDVPGQANMWTTLYRTGASASIFTNVADQATDYKCDGDIDLAFVLDSSGSVSLSNFNLTLHFVASVVDAMPDIGSKVRVAEVVFDSSARVEFHFNRYTDKSVLRRAILATAYNGGGTNTADALDLTRTSVFTIQNGMRGTDAKRVTVLLTDGVSNSFSATVSAATRLKDVSSTVLFAIGIGGYYMNELQAVATQPICSHIYTLDSFSFINSILLEIKKSACEAKVILKANSSWTETIPVNGTEVPIETKPETNDTVIDIEVDCGEVETYVSFSDPNPGPAIFDEHHTALHAKPARVALTSLGSVYLKLFARRVSDAEAKTLNCNGFNYTVTVNPKPEDANPCTAANREAGLFYFPYKPDKTKFIQCDNWGNAYIMPCPPNLVWIQAYLTCGFP